jgi:hypothetical protein
LETDLNHKDYRRYEMHTEETKDKGGTAKSAVFGFAPMGQGMFEMMNKCCTGRGGFPDCSTMTKGMMETMRNQPCCTPREDTQSERRKS